MKPLRLKQWVCLLVLLPLTGCSFMPDDLEAFFKLPLPQVAQGTAGDRNTPIGYVRTGNPNGIPVVFIHGSPGSWEDWKLVLTRERITRRFCLIAVDRPGWGRSAASGVVTSLTAQSKALSTVLDVCAPQKSAILVGHSLGGPIAARMAVDFPDKTAALILLAPSLDPTLDAVLWYNRLADTKLVKMILPTPLARANDEIMPLPAELTALGRDLAAIRVPTIVVQGQKDELVHPDNAVYARRKLVNATLREIELPNFGHLIPHLRPAEVVLALEDAADMIAE